MSGLTAVEGSPRPPAPPPAAGPEALGSPVEKQVGDLKLRQIARREHLIFRPQPLGDLTDRGAAQQAAAGGIGKHRLNVAGRQLARIHLHRQTLQLLGAALHHFASKPTTSPVRVAIGMTFSAQPAACLDPSGPGERNFALPKPVKGSILASQPLGSRQMSVEGGGPR